MWALFINRCETNFPILLLIRQNRYLYALYMMYITLSHH